MHTYSVVQSCPTLCDSVNCSPPGFQDKIWSGLPFLPPGDLPNPEIEPASLMSPALASRFFTTSARVEIKVNLWLPPLSK